MTREEEIRKLAEWIGIKLSHFTYDGRMQERVETDTCYYDKELDWNPFTRIEDAFMLVEKIEEWKLEYESGGYSFTITYDWPPDRWITGCSETAPEAICNAVLKLIESEVGDEPN